MPHERAPWSGRSERLALPPDGTGVDVALAADRKSAVVMTRCSLSAARHLLLALPLHNFTNPSRALAEQAGAPVCARRPQHVGRIRLPHGRPESRSPVVTHDDKR